MDKLKEYFNGDDLAASVWKGKYAIEEEVTPEDMHRRMAKEFARIEFKTLKEKQKKDDDDYYSDFGSGLISMWGKSSEKELEDLIFSYFDKFGKIVPQGSVMAILGNKKKIGSISNCFVIGQPHDSYGGIMQKDQQLVQLMKRRELTRSVIGI
jgi:ribonucleoside-diphosphate reductase alpha chain